MNADEFCLRVEAAMPRELLELTGAHVVLQDRPDADILFIAGEKIICRAPRALTEHYVSVLARFFEYRLRNVLDPVNYPRKKQLASFL